jgi:hypothetical protein
MLKKFLKISIIFFLLLYNTNAEEIQIKEVTDSDSSLAITFINVSDEPIYLDISNWVYEDVRKKNKFNDNYNFGLIFGALEKYNNSILSFMHKSCYKMYLPISFRLRNEITMVPNIIEVSSQDSFIVKFDISLADTKAFKIMDSICVAVEFPIIDKAQLEKYEYLISGHQAIRVYNIGNAEGNCLYVDKEFNSYVNIRNEKILLRNDVETLDSNILDFYQLLLTDRIFLSSVIESKYKIEGLE